MHVAKAVAWYFAASMVLWLLDIAIGQDIERYVAAQGVAHGWPKAAASAYAVVVGLLSLLIRFGPAYLLWRGWTLERIATTVLTAVQSAAHAAGNLTFKKTWQFWLLVAWITYALNHSNSNPAAPPSPPEPAPAAQAQPIAPIPPALAQPDEAQLEQGRREFEEERVRRILEDR